MNIFRVTALTDEVAEAFARLIPQLKLSLPPLSREGLARLLASDASVLLAARYPDERAPIVGLLTLVVYRVPTGVHARIEDVVVDEAMRGQGIGEALVKHALHMAQAAGADGVALTSNPKRAAANRLYGRMGFKRWETNTYFYEFG